MVNLTFEIRLKSNFPLTYFRLADSSHKDNISWYLEYLDELLCFAMDSFPILFDYERDRAEALVKFKSRDGLLRAPWCKRHNGGHLSKFRMILTHSRRAILDNLLEIVGTDSNT